MIWLQYEDPAIHNGGEFLKDTYSDDEYEQALFDYEKLRAKWESTRFLFENDERPTDWVILQDHSIRQVPGS